MEVFPLTPTEEIPQRITGNKGFWGDRFRFSLSFSNLDDTSKKILLSFHSQNAFRPFRYFTKGKLVGLANSTVLPCKNPQAVAAYSAGGVNLWVNEDVTEVKIEAGSSDTYESDLILPPQGTIRVSLEWVGEAEYLAITKGGILLTVSVQEDNLVLSVKTAGESNAVAVKVGELYDGGELGKVISFTLTYDGKNISLHHNGQSASLIDPGIDFAAAQFVTYQNTYDFIVLETELPSEIARTINKELVDEITITAGTDSITLSQQVPARAYGNLGITAEFQTKDLKIDEPTKLTIVEA